MAKILDINEAVQLIKSNCTIMVGGFGNIGNPKKLIDLMLIQTFLS